MSDASIVQTLTLNQTTSFQTPPGVNRVKIHNDSSYYLRVYFGLGPPGSANSGGWHDTIGPGASPVLPIVGAAQSSQQGLDLTNSNTSATYAGQVVVLPFLPVGAPLPSGGVISGAALCYLTSYYPNELTDSGGQVEAFVQAAKQGRYQLAGPGSVVATPTIAYDQTTALGTLTLLDNIGGPSGALFKANQAGVSVINLYLFAWGGTFRNLGPNVASLGQEPGFAITATGGSPTRQATFITVQRLSQTVNFGADNWAYHFLNPVLIQFSFLQGVLASTDELHYRFSPYSPPTGQGVFDGTLWATYLLDKINQTPLFALPPQPEPGVLTNMAWNAVYNPQTY